MCDLCGAAPNPDDRLREYVLAKEIGITDVRSTLAQTVLGEYTVETSYTYIDTVDVSLCKQCLKSKILKERIKSFVWALLVPVIGYGFLYLLAKSEDADPCVGLAAIFLSLSISGFLLWQTFSPSPYFDAAAAKKVAAHRLADKAFSRKEWSKLRARKAH